MGKHLFYFIENKRQLNFNKTFDNKIIVRKILSIIKLCTCKCKNVKFVPCC